MIKYIYTHGKIYECDVSIISPRPRECLGDEQLYLVEAPEKFKGEKWYSHLFRDTVLDCEMQFREAAVNEINRQCRRKKLEVTIEDLANLNVSVDIVNL